MSTQSPEAPAVDISDLSFSYGDFLAVQDVSLRVSRGEVFSLLGTNGAGKTTTLELLQGYRRPSSGRIEVLGYDPVREGKKLRRRTGFMLQEAGFVAELTVAEMLRLWSSLSSREDDPDALLERVALTHRRDVQLNQLSGGEKRRVDIALTVWGSPDLVVLDEPTTGLDPESRRGLWSLVEDLRDSGTTIILTTHYLEEAEELSDRLAIMHAGRIAVSGTVREVLESHPATIRAEMPTSEARNLPRIGSTTTRTEHDGDTAIVVQTRALQSDLTELLAWADHARIEFSHLAAESASLESVFHAARADAEQATEHLESK